MDRKKRDLSLTFVLVLLLFYLNIFLYDNPKLNSPSGYFIDAFAKGEIPKIYEMPIAKEIIFISISLLLVIVAILAFHHFKRKERMERNAITSPIFRKKSKSRTDIDSLYDILKAKKKIMIKTIALEFKIDKNQAMEWAKILEDSDLGFVSYPMFGEPFIELKEKLNEEKKDIGEGGMDVKKENEGDEKRDDSKEVRSLKRVSKKKNLKKLK